MRLNGTKNFLYIMLLVVANLISRHGDAKDPGITSRYIDRVQPTISTTAPERNIFLTTECVSIACDTASYTL